MMQSGLDAVISEMPGRDAICHGAAVAGSAVSRPSLRSLEPPYDLRDRPGRHTGRRDSGGLNLLDFSVVSEGRSAHPKNYGIVEITRYIAVLTHPFRGRFSGSVIFRRGARAGAAAELRRIA